MTVYWHIGPHKTGTTALQHALRQRAASAECSYFYPVTSLVEDVAHAQLAWRFLGLAGCAREPEILLKRVAVARKAGFKKVVFSSEEFSRAIFVDGKFESFARFCEQVDCELVITLSPLAERVLPELQEAVKHGESFDPESLPDLVRLCTTRPGLRPDFLSSAILGTKAARVSVIRVDKRQPEKIYQAMGDVIGESLPAPAAHLVNPSWPFMKTAWLSAFNKHLPHVPWEASRSAVEAAFNAAVNQYPAIETVSAPRLPAVFAEYVAGVWQAQLEFLDALQTAGRLRSL